jgi:hypothetical protein
LAASLSAYNEEQRRCSRRWICLWGSMGVGLTPPRLCSAIRPKGRGLRFDPGYHAKAAAAQRYARQEAARGIGQRLAPVPGQHRVLGDGSDRCDPHARSAAAGVCELYAAGAGRRAAGSARRGGRSAAGAGDVRAGCPAASAAGVYRAYLAQSQVFVGVYWQSYGWVAPGDQVSGLEDEYRLAADLPRLI